MDPYIGSLEYIPLQEPSFGRLEFMVVEFGWRVGVWQDGGLAYSHKRHARGGLQYYLGMYHNVYNPQERVVPNPSYRLPDFPSCVVVDVDDEVVVMMRV